MKWTSIGQKRKVAELDRGEDINSELSLPKKMTNLYEYGNFLSGFRLCLT